MPHLLRRKPTLYNCHLRGPVVERLAVELYVPFFDLGLSRPGIEPRTPAHEANALPRSLEGVSMFKARHCFNALLQRLSDTSYISFALNLTNI